LTLDTRHSAAIQDPKSLVLHLGPSGTLCAPSPGLPHHRFQPGLVVVAFRYDLYIVVAPESVTVPCPGVPIRPVDWDGRLC
jgi:hypothetical protein